MLRKISLLTVFILSSLISGHAFTEKAAKEKSAVNVIITFNVKPEKLGSFIKVLESVKKSPSTVKGWTSVNIYKDLKNPTVFTLVELWESKELHKRHLDNLVKSGAWASISKHLTSNPTSSYFSEL